MVARFFMLDYNLRLATRHDVAALSNIEQQCFSIDNFSSRNFRYLLTKANAYTLVAFEAEQDKLLGYIMLLFRRGTKVARIYSIAAKPARQGIASHLLQAAEQQALIQHCQIIHLEIRQDNLTSQLFFQRHGYNYFARYEDYYSDKQPALRFKKHL